ncbi:MAG: 3-hydroxyacyl-[acyl-carrier-protein] dehydratase FabZ [Planctomycetota bacterium]
MRWMWIDKVVEYEPGTRLVAVKNCSLAEEHLHDHFAADEHGPSDPVMPASLLLEGMAQTAGILVGSLSRFREKVVLAKIVSASIDDEVRPGHAGLDAAWQGRVRLQPSRPEPIRPAFPRGELRLRGELPHDPARDGARDLGLSRGTGQA